MEVQIVRDVIFFLGVFFVVWWLILFMALPIGVERENNVKKGNDPGAPKKHGLKKKFLYTTIISFLISLIITLIVRL